MHIPKGPTGDDGPSDPRDIHTRGSFFVRARVAVLGAIGSVTLAIGVAGAQEPGGLAGQGGDSASRSRLWAAGAQVIPMVTRVSPAMAGEGITEGYLSQAVLWGGVANRGLALRGMLNLEGVTIERGELNPGIWGEGYFDRRHPHTYLHELAATGALGSDRLQASVTFGRGFAPFGTDDPMVRPLVKYPANHHLAQVLERLVLIGAVRWAGVIVEGALFNGDEPTSPASLPMLERFGDSHALRLTALLVPALELQGSYASLASPEFRAGSGLDHRKQSLSLRYGDPAMGVGARYLLAEWGRTHEYNRDIRTFTFETLLAEAAVGAGPARIALRLERTTRPEEERAPRSPFRTVRPHGDAHLLGITRWNLATARLDRPREQGRTIGVEPFLEVTRARAIALRTPSAWVPAEVYGSDRIWSVSVGAKLSAGPSHGRMGRYGAALVSAVAHRH